MAPPGCLICGRSTHSKKLGATTFIECLSCGYAVLADPPARTDYWSESQDHHVSDYWTGAKRAYFSGALELLERQTERRRLLDVGGGVGFFCELALDRGWDAYSLDISKQATALAAERLGSDRTLSRLDDVPDGSFDVITLWCVVAHTLDPHQLMKAVKRCLSSDGLVWLTTPNFDFQKPYAHVRYRLGKPIDFAAEDHLGHFTVRSLAELLARNRFSSPVPHLVGITERCLIAASQRRSLVVLKRAYNLLAFGLSRLGLRDYVSELQVTARALPTRQII